jgi:hypothetical protein
MALEEEKLVTGKNVKTKIYNSNYRPENVISSKMAE